MTTLQQIIEAIKNEQKPNAVSKRKERFATKYLGKFKGVIPTNKTSTGYIRELREKLYGKIK
ncbi:MAG: hypothetical protein AB1633_03490 [Elusimicrobiota bacterium]